MRAFYYPIMMILALTMFGCSDGGSDAPATNEAHPQGWIKQHGAEARKSPNFADCTVCHGADLRGQGKVPSCYSASYNGQSCHAGGPGAPHPLDGTYRSGAAHGPDAKVDLTACQSCHGQSGGPGSNPRFNRGIGGQGCEGCHGVNLAHPSNWAGPNNTFHYTAQNIQQSCVLCHGVALDGVGGVGVSCLGCHASVTSFTLDCAFCHGYPPDGSADLDVPSGVNHRQAANISSHNGCAMCHGVKQSDSGGDFAPVANYALFDQNTGTPGDHWNGKINMNRETAYNESNFGCDAAGCHGNDVAHRLSDSGLTVALGEYGAPSVVHPLDATWLLPSGTAATSHVLAALATTPPASNCLGCHALSGAGGSAPSCATCHAPAGPNLVLGSCNSCHATPPDGVVAVGNARPNREGGHAEHDVFTAAKEDCNVCHSGAGTDALNHYDTTAPANVAFVNTYNAKSGAAVFDATSGSCSNVSCHGGQTSPAWLTGTLDVDTQCASCHQAGTAQYNSYTNPDDESHTFHINMGWQCTTCHNTTTLATNHFINLDTQAMEGPASATIGGGTTRIPAGSYIPASRSCDPACHGAQTW